MADGGIAPPAPGRSLGGLLPGHWLLIAAALAAVALHAPGIGGFLLSDSASLVRACHTNAQDGTLLAYLGQAFREGQPWAASMYRPFGMVLTCLDAVLFQASPAALRATELAWHLVNGLLLYALGLSLFRRHAHATLGAATAAAVFWLSPVAPEISAWVAGRFNALAQFGMVLALLAHWHRRTGWALVAAVFALGSKEAAVVLPALLSVMSWWRDDRPPEALTGRLWRSVRETWPYWLLLVVYFAWRWLIFDAPLSVYGGGSPAWPGLLTAPLDRLATLARIALTAWAPNPVWFALFIAVPLLALAVGLWWSRRAGAGSAFRMTALWAGGAVLAVALMVDLPDATGAGARVFYSAGAWLALALGAVVVMLANRRSNRVPAAGSALALAIAFTGVAGIAQTRPLADWVGAAGLADRIRTAMPTLAAEHASHEWSLILVPEHYGVALVGRNAQGSLVLPPYQDSRLLPPLVPFLGRDLDLWRQRLVEGFDDELSMDGRSLDPMPAGFYCADSERGDVYRVRVPRASWRDEATWAAAWARALRGAPCARGHVLPANTRKALRANADR